MGCALKKCRYEAWGRMILVLLLYPQEKRVDLIFPHVTWFYGNEKR